MSLATVRLRPYIPPGTAKSGNADGRRLACTSSSAAQPGRRALSIRSIRRADAKPMPRTIQPSIVDCCASAMSLSSGHLTHYVAQLTTPGPFGAGGPDGLVCQSIFARYVWPLPIGTNRTGRSADDLVHETLRNGNSGRPHPADARILSSIVGRRSNVKIASRHGPVVAPATFRRSRGRPV